MQELAAPEGTRYAVLFSFAEGGKVRFLTPSACATIGSLMGRLHQLTAGQFLARTTYTPEVLLTQAYAAAQTFFADELPEMRQVLLVRLFVPDSPDGAPRIAEYTGRGPVQVWLPTCFASHWHICVRLRCAQAVPAAVVWLPPPPAAAPCPR